MSLQVLLSPRSRILLGFPGLGKAHLQVSPGQVRTSQVHPCQVRLACAAGCSKSGPRRSRRRGWGGMQGREAGPRAAALTVGPFEHPARPWAPGLELSPRALRGEELDDQTPRSSLLS